MAFKRGMTVDLRMEYLLMLVSMTLTMMEGHRGKHAELKYLDN